MTRSRCDKQLKVIVVGLSLALLSVMPTVAQSTLTAIDWSGKGTLTVEASTNSANVYEIDYFEDGLVQEIRSYSFSPAGVEASNNSSLMTWELEQYRGELLERRTVSRNGRTITIIDHEDGSQEVTSIMDMQNSRSVLLEFPDFPNEPLRLEYREVGMWDYVEGNGELYSEIRFGDNTVSTSGPPINWPTTFRYTSSALAGYSQQRNELYTAQYEIIERDGRRYEIANWDDFEWYYVYAPKLTIDEQIASLNDFIVSTSVSRDARFVVSAFSMWSLDHE